MTIDTNYLNKLTSYFVEVHDREPSSFVPVSIIIKTLFEGSSNKEKFIEHVKYYIDTRTYDLPDVHFKSDYSSVYIGHTQESIERLFNKKKK